MNQRKTELDALAIGLLLASCLLWGFQQVLIKATLPEVAPLFQGSLRVLGATLLLGLWCFWRRIPLFKADGSLAAGLLAGALFAAEFTCIYTGMQYTSASRLTVFLYTPPFWVALLVPLWVGAERLRGLQWLGLLAAFAAVLFALREGFLAEHGATLRGDLLGVLAGLQPGAVIDIARSAQTISIDLLTDDRLIGRGEIVALGDGFGVRVRELIAAPR